MYKIIEYDKIYDEKVKKLITEVFIEEFEFEEYREAIKDENISLEYLLNGGNFWIALDYDDNVIGTIGAKVLEKNILEIKRVYVKKDCRGMGISQKLFNILENFAIEKGFESLFLGTYDKLERAIGFYYKNNFIDDESREKEEGIKYMSKCLKSIPA